MVSVGLGCSAAGSSAPRSPEPAAAAAPSPDASTADAEERSQPEPSNEDHSRSAMVKADAALPEKSNPQRICDRMKEMALAEAPPGRPEGETVSDADMRKCLEELAKRERADPQRVSKLADCIVSCAKMEDAMRCMMADAQADFDEGFQMEEARDPDDTKLRLEDAP